MKILVLSRDADAYRQMLSPGDDAEVEFCDTPSQAAGSFDVLLAEPDYAADYLSAGFGARWIQSTWAGVRPIVDALARSSAQPQITGVRDIFGPQISEYVMAYLLRLSRRSALFEQQQQQRQWQELWPDRLTGKKLTIVGTGSIGSHLARVASAFGMMVTGVSRSGSVNDAFHVMLPLGQCHKALAGADVVVLTLPDTPETEGLIDRMLLASMGDNSVFINVGRGSTVDETALAELMAENPNRSALLDVFQTEPLPADSPLWRLPNVTITPHVSAVSYPQDIANIFTQNLARYRKGEPLLHLVDVNRGY